MMSTQANLAHEEFNGTGQKGYRTVAPKMMYSDGSGLTFNSTRVAGDVGAPGVYETHQMLRDKILFCVEPVAGK